jgi:hypothetical protein
MICTDDAVAQVRALIRPTVPSKHQGNVMPSVTSVSDISCEMSDGIPFVDGGQGEHECELPDDWCDDHRPDYNYEDEQSSGDNLDENSDDGVGDRSEYIATHCRNREFGNEFDDRDARPHELLRLELLVAELESQLNLKSIHGAKNDTSFFRRLLQEQQQGFLEQENTILMRKLAGMHEDLFAERSNSMKSQVLMQDKINALKSEMDWICERNSSLLEANLELKSMLRRSEKFKDKSKMRAFEGELICPFPTTGERLQRRMSNESNGSSIITETVEPSYYSVQHPTAVPRNTRSATVQSTKVYVPFPKERRRRTVDCNPFNSKHYGLLDKVLAFFPRVRGVHSRSRDDSSINTDDFSVRIDQEPNTSPGLFICSSHRQPVLFLQQHRHQEHELAEQHESWSPAEEINTQTKLFNIKSLAKIDKSSRTTSGSTSFTTAI